MDGVKNMKFEGFIIGCFVMGGILGILIHNWLISDEPTALDVYQGKTTLEITYRDSVPVDSVVVFKDEFK